MKFFDAAHSAAHRGESVHAKDEGHGNIKYEVEAIIPVIAGLVISAAMFIMITLRCFSNAKKSPDKLRKIVKEGPPPTLKEFYSDDDVVNGMYT